MQEKKTYKHIWNVQFENSTNKKTTTDEKKQNLTLLKNVLESIDPQNTIDKNINESSIDNSNHQKTK